MSLYINKIKFIVFLCALLAIGGCASASSPWHRDQSELFLNKGISFIGLQQYPSALKELLEAEKYNAGDYRIYYYMGMVYHNMGMKEKAIEKFQKAISLKDDYSEAHNYLGTLYLNEGLWDKAIVHFDQAVANPLYSTPAVPLYNAGWAYYSKKDYSKAMDRNRRALQREPETVLRPQIEKNIGLIYFDQSDMPNAIVHFNKSVELNPNLFDAHFFLGESYLNIKDKVNAKKSFQAVVNLAPQSGFGKKAKIYLQSLK
jgi:type IV pilus assembly protein PilF